MGLLWIRILRKYLSFILRHKPEDIGLVLGGEGWTSVDELIDKTKGFKLSIQLLNVVVEKNDKQRFKFNPDRTKIKANQGHSIKVSLQLEAIEPPEYLLHGTADRLIASITTQGLTKQSRHHVHLSESEDVALAVGSRYGKAVLPRVNTKEMYESGFLF